MRKEVRFLYWWVLYHGDTIAYLLSRVNDPGFVSYNIGPKGGRIYMSKEEFKCFFDSVGGK